jgi:hypothetical protein
MMEQENIPSFDQEIAAHGVIVEYPRTFPEVAIDYNMFGKEAESIKKSVAALEDWLTHPYVTDEFGGQERHNERRKWRSEMQLKYNGTADEARMKQLFHGNKQSNNGLTIAYGYLQVLVSVLQENSQFMDLAKRIEILEAKAPPASFFAASARNEKPPTPEERREKIEQLEDVIYGTLQALGEFSRERTN